MITVYDDAPEQIKELKERGTTDEDEKFEPSENRGARLSPVKYDRRRDFHQR